MKLTFAQIKALQLPSAPGSYQFLDEAGVIIYVGKAVNLRARVWSYWQKSSELSPAKHRMLDEIATVRCVEVGSEVEALLLEANLVKKFQPKYNILLRDDKRFSYILVTSQAEVPTVKLTRSLREGGDYFGPFTSATAVKTVLKILRKVWPYCSVGQVLTQPCFYYQIGLCPGVCGAVISRGDYLKNYIQPLKKFLAGGRTPILKAWASQQQKLARVGDAEGVERLVWQQKQFERILSEHKVLSLDEKFSADTLELAKVLGLPKPIARLEAYDISQAGDGQVGSAVGSLVVLLDGEAEPSQYKRFKLSPTQAGDVPLLQEMLTRRLKHAEWPLPDLLVIDGGRAQLNAIKKVVAVFGLTVPIVAIAKGDGLRSARARDKLFLWNQLQPLTLDLSASALHLVKRARDEAHRFAIGYQRQRRRRSFLA